MDRERIESKLRKPVRELIELIYNVEAMQQAMLYFNIDPRKTPLENINKNRILNAFKVLKEISGLIDEYAVPHQFVEASNRFYDLIPHHFGIQPAPIMNSDEAVKNKTEMLKALLCTKIANILLNQEIQEDKNRLDTLYDRLNCVILPVSEVSPEFEVIRDYVKRSELRKILPTPKIEIKEIFKIRRFEEQHFETFKHYGNRQLLWYGSRTTNFVGILRNGLMFDPCEGLIESLRFGNGIYFSDMAFEALNDSTNSNNDTCLLLLCEVILGNQLELTGTENLAHFEINDAHSVKIIGKIYPDPNNAIITNDDVIIPMGKLITDPAKKTRFQHNGYIVSNPAQVKCSYLIRGQVKWY